ncbi:MAG TPA: hypothetical protein VGP45_01025 [Marinobacter sp.]|nr:hypothetical protein [Marinobacter sp.]
MSTIENTPGKTADSKAPISSPALSTSQPPGSPVPAHEVAAYWDERRRYLKSIRKTSAVRHRYWRAMAVYLLRRVLWSFGFFPVFFAFWIPLVLAQFNLVVMASDIIVLLQNFTGSNPELQANTISTLVIAWASIGGFFLVFDFVLSPFRSPYEYEADVYMRAWEHQYSIANPSTSASAITSSVTAPVTSPIASPVTAPNPSINTTEAS